MGFHVEIMVHWGTWGVCASLFFLPTTINSIVSLKQAGMIWCACFFVTAQNCFYLRNKLYGMDLSRRTINYVQCSVDMPGGSGGRKALLVCCGWTFTQTFRQYLWRYFPLIFCVFQTNHHYKFLLTWHTYFGFNLLI